MAHEQLAIEEVISVNHRVESNQARLSTLRFRCNLLDLHPLSGRCLVVDKLKPLDLVSCPSLEGLSTFALILKWAKVYVANRRCVPAQLLMTFARVAEKGE